MGISHTLKSAIWSLSLLLVIMYTFAIVFTQAKVDYDERVWAYFHALDIDITDAWSLFKILDLQGKVYLNQEEFVQSCLRLRGPAKSVHVAQLLRETHWMRDTLVQISGQLDR